MVNAFVKADWDLTQMVTVLTAQLLMLIYSKDIA